MSCVLQVVGYLQQFNWSTSCWILC